MAGVAMWGAKHDYGPFVQPSRNVTLLLLISFVGTASLMTLLVAAVMTERRKRRQKSQNSDRSSSFIAGAWKTSSQHVPGVVWEAWGKPGRSEATS